MNPWLRRILLLSTLGGGFAGLAFTFQLVPQAIDHPENFVALALFVFVFGLGVFAGWQLSENRQRAISLTAWFLAFQVPFFSSPFFGFGFIAGLGIRIGVSAEGLVVGSRLGGEAMFSVLQGAKWAVAINVVALLLLVLCLRARQHEPSGLREA